MKSKYNAAKFRHQTLGASLVTAIMVCLSGSASASDWTGSTSSNWNDNANWSGGGGTVGSNAVISVSTPHIATITANIPGNPVDIIIGSGGGTNGRLDHISGNAYTGNGNWMFVGNGGGNGVYNLADTTGTGGILTGYAKGSGNMTSNRFWVGGVPWNGGGSGVANINTTGIFEMNDLTVGDNAGTGVMNVDAGTINTHGWNFIGKDDGGGNNAHGTLNMSGGSINNTGRTWVGMSNTTGIVVLSGGAYKQLNNEFLSIGDSSGGNGTVTLNNSASLLQANGELWVGQNTGTGQLNLSAGAITSANWVAVGRDNGTGTVNMTGGSWTKTAANCSFIIGASGHGTMIQSGGLVDVQAGDTWMAENNLCDFTLSGSGEFRATYFQVARNGGSTGNVHLDGGTLKVNELVGGGGTKNVHFNGTQIVGRVDEPNFITGLGSGAVIDAGGLKVDSAGHTLVATQVLTGTGGVIKSGAGKLTLSSTNTYTGNNTVNAGELALRAGSTGIGDTTVADGAAFGVVAQFSGEQLVAPNITFGTTAAGTSLELNEGNVFGTNPTVPILNVTGNLVLNGNVAVNVAGTQFQGSALMPLVAYSAATRSGTGAFVLGTLPNGVVATFVDNPNYYGAGQGLVYLNITSVSLPVWNATVDANWNTSTVNWIDEVTTLGSVYSDPAPVLFNDAVTGATLGAVVLNGTVAPSDVTFDNVTVPYSLSGTGSISGATGLTKIGAASLTLATPNSYTGVTTLAGGTTSVATMPNGGVAGPLGAATSAASNLVIGAATLSYTGATAATDRGFTIGGPVSAIAVVGGTDLTVSGPVVSALASKLNKQGDGALVLTNPSITLGAVGQVNQVLAGTLKFSGPGQTVSVPGELWVGSVPAAAGQLVLDGTSLSVGGWFTLGRGNGNTHWLSTITATNSTIVCGNFSSGFDNGLLNASDQAITMTNTTWTSYGQTLLSEKDSSTMNMTIDATSVYNANNRLLIGLGAGSVANVTVQGALHHGGEWFSIGTDSSSVATMTVKGSGILTSDGDFNVGDVGSSTGTLNIQNSGSVSSTGNVYIGKNGGTSGTVNMTGGSFTSTGNLFQIGMGTVHGTWLQSGGVTNAGGWIAIGRYNGAIGVVTVSGTGVFNQTGTGNALIVGEEGTGTLNIQGTATVSSVGGNGLVISNNATGNGTVNLDGGTLVTLKISDGGGTSTFSFNGGVLKAGTGANLAFMGGLNTVNVNLGGAFIDTNGQTIAIAQVLSDGGGNLTKQGAGTLELNGANSYLGTTTVAVGTLGGTGSVGGELVVPAGSTIAPGAAGVGTFSADDTLGNGSTIGGTYACEVSGAAADALLLGGDLTISPGAVLDFSLLAPPTAMSYVIATHVTRTGTFIEQNVPAGFHVVYNPTSITLEYIPTAYSNWAVSHGLNPLTNGAPGADPDGDGQSNGVEFALGGDPTSASNNAKTYSLVADSSADGDALPELLITIAVRSGTPAFTGSPSPSATQDGATYTVEGSTTLGSFSAGVTPVAPVTTGLPAAPAGYEYRTFSLDGSNGTPSNGFLRVQVKF
ncbi:MAG: autotransporter-associated beta strand repeat-containing protein [Verrucomicrobiota bacterium]